MADANAQLAKLRASFGIGPAVVELPATRAKRSSARNDTRRMAGVVPAESGSSEAVLPPRLDLYDYQEADVARLLAGNCTGFITAETGAGKTLIAAEVIMRSGVDCVLVIAVRSTIRDTWIERLYAQGYDAEVRRIESTDEGREAYDDLLIGMRGVYIITHALFTRWDFSAANPDLTILDEAHMLTNRKGKKVKTRVLDAEGNQKTTAAGAPVVKTTYTPSGGEKLRKMRSRRRIVMSGTMFRNRFENAWNLLRWVYPTFDEPGNFSDRSYHRWVTYWCATEYAHFAQTKVAPTGELDPGRLARTIPVYIQHFKREACCEFHPEGFLKDLPKPVEITRTVPLLPKQKSMIAQMETDYIAWLGEHPLVAKLPIVARRRIRQMTLGVPAVIPATEDEKEEVYFEPDCPSPTLDDIHDYLKQNPGEKILFLAESQKFLAEATRRFNALGYPSFEWSGQANEKARDAAKAKFITGEVQLVFGQVAAVGTGIDGLQGATNILWSIEVGDDVTNEIQSQGRLDRRGQVQGVVHIKTIREGSLDEGVIGKGLAKQLSLNKSLRRAERKGDKAKAAV
jgi:hypothetical protein